MYISLLGNTLIKIIFVKTYFKILGNIGFIPSAGGLYRRLCLWSNLISHIMRVMIQPTIYCRLYSPNVISISINSSTLMILRLVVSPGE